jgi:hypothetical protein
MIERWDILAALRLKSLPVSFHAGDPLLIVIEARRLGPASRGEIDGFCDLSGNGAMCRFASARISSGMSSCATSSDILPAETPTIHQSSARQMAMRELERPLPVSKGALQSLGSWQTLIPAAMAAARCSTDPTTVSGRCRFNSAQHFLIPMQYGPVSEVFSALRGQARSPAGPCFQSLKSPGQVLHVSTARQMYVSWSVDRWFIS